MQQRGAAGKLLMRGDVRILRGADGQCNIAGLYPCGEGAGYAGGILSAAADGMRCAEQLLEKFR